MDDSDVLTKKQIYDHIKANGGDSSRPSIDLTDYLRKDGSIGMTGHLQINYNGIEDIGNLRNGKSGLTADLDMKNHKIVNLKTPENSTNAVNWSF